MTPIQGGASGTDIKTLVQDWTECYNLHDPDGVASYMSQDCDFTNVGNGQRLEGRAAMREDAVTLYGRTLATASRDRTVLLWDVADPARPAALTPH